MIVIIIQNDTYNLLLFFQGKNNVFKTSDMNGISEFV